MTLKIGDTGYIAVEQACVLPKYIQAVVTDRQGCVLTLDTIEIGQIKCLEECFIPTYFQTANLPAKE